jgi:thiol-disulfide isomerase/thioredoxin
MKQYVLYLLVAICFLFSVNTYAQGTHVQPEKMSHQKEAKNTVDLYFFWSTDCPHCIAAHPFLNNLKREYPWLRVHSYETSGNIKNSQLYAQYAKRHGRDTSFVPAFFIGDKMIIGFSSIQTTGAEIRKVINEYHRR